MDDDRRFFEELAAIERERLTVALAADDSEGGAAGMAAAAVIDQLTDLATRVRVLESAFELALDDRGRSAAALRASGAVDVADLDAECEFSDTPESIDGRRFFWTLSERLEFRLDVQRLRIRFLRIRFASIIKAEYAQQARLSIDGAPVRHWIGRTGSDHYLECAIPISEDLVPSRVTLEIPAVHSPSELGLSDDERRLGIALIGVEFSGRPASSWFSRLLARIRPSRSAS